MKYPGDVARPSGHLTGVENRTVTTLLPYLPRKSSTFSNRPPGAMRRSLLLPTTLLLLLSASSVHAQVAEITGTVTSATGEPFRLAHVHLLPFNTHWEGPLFDHVITSVEVKADGSWELSVGNPGYYEILFTALDHEYFRLPMPIDGGEPEITVDARLALIPVRETLEMKVGGAVRRP